MQTPPARDTHHPASRRSATRRALVVFALVGANLAGASPVGANGAQTLLDLVSNCDGTAQSPTRIALNGDFDAGGRLNVKCHVIINLSGFELTTRGITIANGKHLEIEDSSGSFGTLTAVATQDGLAGIQTTGAELMIHGGTITATGRENAAGIGGGDGGSGGTITIDGGDITATGGYNGAGIGGGKSGGGGTITIDGGTINATGGENAAGIGGGEGGSGGTITIYDGTIDARGGRAGAGIGGGEGGSGGTITIYDGTTTAIGGNLGAGIGGGPSGAGGNVVINNGAINATGGDFGAGIGGGESGDGGSITINDGTITATGGDARGAGIGGGHFGAGGTILINNGTITATGSAYGAGIGGGPGSDGGTITINDGTITATGGMEGAGIGGGLDGDGGTITIDDGTITATGGNLGAGIGGGADGDGGTVTIGQGALVSAVGSSAVGHGEFGTVFGSLSLAGTLRVPSGTLVVPDSDANGAEVTIAATGQLLGSVAEPTESFTITGAGQIDNGGVISLVDGQLSATVLDHHYEVSFDLNGGAADATPTPVTVFASSLESGYRELPANPTRPGWTFRGWFTEPDGTGTPITATSTLPGSSHDGHAVEITAYAAWKRIPAPSPAPETTRIAGPDAIGTGIAASEDLFADRNDPGDTRRRAGSVVLATAGGYADGLVAAPLAVALNAPLLLTDTEVVDARVLGEIERIIGPGTTVHLVGGTAALDTTVAETLRTAGYPIVRHAGADRFATAAAVADAVNRLGPVSTALIATGRNHPDALGAGVAAARGNGVVLLSDHDQPHPTTTRWLQEHPGVRIYAVGGPATIAYPDATPIMGADRYATLTALADTFFAAPTSAGITRADRYEDALTGGTHQAHLGGPVLGTHPGGIPDATRTWLDENRRVTHFWIYGGTTAVPGAIATRLTAR